MIVVAAPAPEIVRLCEIESSPFDTRYGKGLAGTITVSPGVACRIASRSEPGPLSIVLVTVTEPAALAAGDVTAMTHAPAASIVATIRVRRLPTGARRLITLPTDARRRDSFPSLDKPAPAALQKAYASPLPPKPCVRRYGRPPTPKKGNWTGDPAQWAQLDQHANMCSPLHEYGFTITEHDPDRPWMVLASEHRTIKLPDGVDFFALAHGQWPAPRWSAKLDPWQLSSAWRR